MSAVSPSGFELDGSNAAIASTTFPAPHPAMILTVTASIAQTGSAGQKDGKRAATEAAESNISRHSADSALSASH